jgi:hypothetical protein
MSGELEGHFSPPEAGPWDQGRLALRLPVASASLRAAQPEAGHGGGLAGSAAAVPAQARVRGLRQLAGLRSHRPAKPSLGPRLVTELELKPKAAAAPCSQRRPAFETRRLHPGPCAAQAPGPTRSARALCSVHHDVRHGAHRALRQRDRAARSRRRHRNATRVHTRVCC